MSRLPVAAPHRIEQIPNGFFRSLRCRPRTRQSKQSSIASFLQIQAQGNERGRYTKDQNGNRDLHGFSLTPQSGGGRIPEFLPSEVHEHAQETTAPAQWPTDCCRPAEVPR